MAGVCTTAQGAQGSVLQAHRIQFIRANRRKLWPPVSRRYDARLVNSDWFCTEHELVDEAQTSVQEIASDLKQSFEHLIAEVGSAVGSLIDLAFV